METTHNDLYGPPTQYRVDFLNHAYTVDLCVKGMDTRNDDKELGIFLDRMVLHEYDYITSGNIAANWKTSSNAKFDPQYIQAIRARMKSRDPPTFAVPKSKIPGINK